MPSRGRNANDYWYYLAQNLHILAFLTLFLKLYYTETCCILMIKNLLLMFAFFIVYHVFIKRHLMDIKLNKIVHFMVTIAKSRSRWLFCLRLWDNRIDVLKSVWQLFISSTQFFIDWMYLTVMLAAKIILIEKPSHYIAK